MSRARRLGMLARGEMSDSAWALASELIVTAGAVVSFSQLALVLTALDFGILASTQALARPAMALCVLGAPALLIRRISQGSPVKQSWLTATTMWYLGAAVVAVLLVALQPIVLGPAPFLAYSILIVSFTLFTSQGELLAGLAIGLGDMKMVATTRLLVTAPRVVALGIMAVLRGDDLLTWAVLAAGANFVGNVGCWWYGRRKLGVGLAFTSLSIFRGEAKLGAGYSMSGLGEGVLDASDRPILVNTGFGTEAGLYSIAARLVSFALFPALALMRASTAEIYGRGKDGIAASMAATKRWLVATTVLNLAIGLVMFFGAPLVLLVLPDTHEVVPSMIRWLAFLPLVRSAQYMAGNVLDAAGYQYYRFVFTMAAAGLNLALNLVLIPRYSWQAAVVTTMLAEVALLVLLGGFAGYGARKNLPARAT